MSNNKIRVIVARVGKHPVVEEIDSGLDGMQAVVGGYIECVSLDGSYEDGVDLWLNEEGRINGMRLNRLIRDDRGNDWDVHGDVFLARHDSEGDTIGLTDEDVAKWLQRLTDSPVSIMDIP
jgi:hypothetical protein